MILPLKYNVDSKNTITMFQDIESLKMKLKSVTKLKLGKAREEFALRNQERLLSEELRTTQMEIEYMFLQLEDIKQELSKMKYQVAMIGICEASEKSKIENHINAIVKHQNDFHKLFSKENEAKEMHKLDIKKKQEHEKEMEEQKGKLLEDKIEVIVMEAKTIEEECDDIDQECAVLKKRNNAIMLKLRRKLIESENVRWQLMNSEHPTEPTSL